MSDPRQLSRRERRLHSRLLREIHSRCKGQRACLRSLAAERERCPYQVRDDIMRVTAAAAAWQWLHHSRGW